MRAAIDIGSNSVRLALPDGTVTSQITQLAFGIQDSGVLSPVGVTATIEALKQFKATCDAQGVSDIYVFATEAVRRAKDGDEFCDKVKQATGLTVNVLSGIQEAELALRGVTKPDGPVTVCDLGGGSLEIICSRDGKNPDYINSLPLGVVVLKNMFNGDFRQAIDEMPKMLTECSSVPRNNTVVLCGGSACNIAAAMLNLKVYDKNAVSTKFTARQLDDIMPILLSKRLSVLRPICTKRADTLPYGAILFQTLLNYLGAVEFYVSDASNLEAVLNNSEFGIKN
ncbi:MAG: hypothetical protein K2M89_02200 [Clostridiales bacterium]|nr:hypothetical protein [Clostridiales bacterium]